MPADLLPATFPPAAAVPSFALSPMLAAALPAALLAALLAPLPAQAQAQRVDVCALVACSASGQRGAAFAAPAPARVRPGAQAAALPPSTAPVSAAADHPEPSAPRDPWTRRFQGRETEDDDVCLLNFGLNGQLARKGSLDTHVLGRTQAWRAPAR